MRSSSSISQDGRLVVDWLAHLKGQPAAPFHVPLALWFRGRLDVEALELAINGVIERHESLRTGFPDVTRLPPSATRALLADLQGSAVLPPPLFEQDIHPDTGIELHVGGPESCGSVGPPVLSPASLADAFRPFDASRPPLMRATLVRRAAEDHVLLLVFDHLSCDGWSLGIFRREFTTLYRHYRGDPSDARLEPLPIQYRDFAARQRSSLHTSEAQTLITHAWREWGEFQGAQLHAEELRAASDHGEALPAFRGTATCTPSLSARVKAYCRAASISAYMFHVAALYLVSRALGRRSKAVIWAPYANRSDTDSERIIGWCAGEAPLAIDIPGAQPLAALVDTVRASILGMTTRPFVPRFVLERLTYRGRRFSAGDRVEVILRMGLPETLAAETLPDGLEVRGLRSLPVRHGDTIQFLAEAAETGMKIHCIYPEGLMPRSGGEHLLRRMMSACECLVDRPHETVESAVDHLAAVGAGDRLGALVTHSAPA